MSVALRGRTEPNQPRVSDAPGSGTASNPYLVLWRTVLAEAIEDMFRGSEDDRAHKRRWVGGRDFRLVCALAGLDHSAVEASIARRAQVGCLGFRGYRSKRQPMRKNPGVRQ